MEMYFIAVVLPEELNKEIIVLKNLAFEKWGCQVGLKSSAHITIAPPFWMDETFENDLLNDVDSMAAEIESFYITTNNFSAFKPRTLFIDVAKNDALENAKKASDSFFKLHQKYNVKVESRPFHPHITIATRDLRKSSFYEAWDIFKDQTYKKEFLAEGFAVLKHNKKNWDVVHTSQFKKLL